MPQPIRGGGITSCAGGRHNMPSPPVTLIFDLLTLKVVSGVTCDVRYICANFSLPRPLSSRLRPDVRNRQTSDRQTDRQTNKQTSEASSLNAPAQGAGHNNTTAEAVCAATNSALLFH